MPSSNYEYVKLGAHKNPDFSTRKIVPISEWRTHPGAKPHNGPKQHRMWSDNTGGVDSDYSILILGQQVQFTDNIQPVCLPSKLLPNKDYALKEVWVSGWGYTHVGSNNGKVNYGKSSEFPKRVKLIVRDEATCRRNDKIHCEFCGRSTMLCAYGAGMYNATINTDSCQGDSGGNLFYVSYQIIGVSINVAAIRSTKTK